MVISQEVQEWLETVLQVTPIIHSGACLVPILFEVDSFAYSADGVSIESFYSGSRIMLGHHEKEHVETNDYKAIEILGLTVFIDPDLYCRIDSGVLCFRVIECGYPIQSSKTKTIMIVQYA
jgi:hypothetical protein